MPYTDDLGIANEDDLWRRIHPSWVFFDANEGRVRPTSQAFKDSSDGTPMSALLAKEDTPHRALAASWGEKGFSLAAITAGLARQRGLGVVRDPQPEDPPHLLVFGDKTKFVREGLALAARWVGDPPSVANR